jgi:hypothetical protein
MHAGSHNGEKKKTGKELISTKVVFSQWQYHLILFLFGFSRYFIMS